MKNIKKVIIGISAVAILAACSKTGQRSLCPTLGTSEVPESVQQSFSARYPAATAEAWYNKDDEAYVAQFEQNSQQRLAYFEVDGEYLYTEADIDGDGKIDNEVNDWNDKDFNCEDFEMDKLKNMVSECLKDRLAMMKKKQTETKGSLEKLDMLLLDLDIKYDNAQTDEERKEILAHMEKVKAEMKELNYWMEEIEKEMMELQELLEMIELDELDKDKLCGLLKDCWWKCDKDKGEKDKGKDKKGDKEGCECKPK